MQATYDAFVEKAAAGRNTTPERIDAIAQGRVWTGKQAKELGLVDELGGLDRALALAKDAREDRREQRGRAGRLSAEEVALRGRQRSVGPHRRAAARSARSSARRTPGPSKRVTAPLRLFRRGEPLTLMPNVFVR